MDDKIAVFKLLATGMLTGLNLTGGVIAPVQAHQAQSGWTYPVECCSDAQDCQVINGRDVSNDKDGYIVTLEPGEHRHAPEGGTFYMLDRQVKQSGDDNFHVCIHEYTNGPGAICLYIPPQSMSLLNSMTFTPPLAAAANP